jgi:hypothetical protein
MFIFYIETLIHLDREISCQGNCSHLQHDFQLNVSDETVRRAIHEHYRGGVSDHEKTG